MAEAEVSGSVHEHIEPNALNVAIIVAILVVALGLLKYGANKYPNALGGFAAL
jgi:hypothetical protein